MVSIIIPAFNVEKYIVKCVESALNQTLEDIEIIIVDDGSTDGTSKICIELERKNKKIKYKRIENSGCSVARNLGLSLSTKEFVAFLDSDDWVEKTMYEDLYKKAKSNNSDIVICGFKKINENGRLLSTVKIPENLTKDEYTDCKTEWFSSPCNKIYRKEMLEKYSVNFLLNVYTGEDMFFNFKAFFYADKISAIDFPYYNYYMNQYSVSNNYRNRTDIYIVLEKLIEFYKMNGQYEENIKKIQECLLYHGIMYPFDVLQKMKENKIDEWEKIYEEVRKNIKKFKKLETLEIKKYYFYRRSRLKMMFLKKYKMKLLK
ncbi:MAG: glycosyltransferase family 2 protein [Cetobacterium sp.]|uniref:glycosyltransferase family 2 protein n=1 Tax=Cetobacterium sp. TaxID=2071632 RepID=UPI002FC8A2EC